MAFEIPDKGLNWFRDKSIDEVTGTIEFIGVGTDDTAPTTTDESLSQEVYRASKDLKNCTITKSSNTGEVDCTITVTAGTNVDSGTTVRELGLFASDGTLLYREVRSPVEIAGGERVTLNFGVTFNQ